MGRDSEGARNYCWKFQVSVRMNCCDNSTLKEKRKEKKRNKNITENELNKKLYEAFI